MARSITSRLPANEGDRSRQWIGIDQLAAELGVPVRTIYAWRSARKGPRAARFGKHLRFARVDVDAWAEQQKDQPAGGPR